MDLNAVIEGRRSVRKYQNRPVEEEKINRVLNAARLAPSAMNSQSWKFIVVTDPAVRARLEKEGGVADFACRAPVVLVACGLNTGIMTNGHRADSIDLSIAMSFAILEAYNQGLGTCWLASYREDRVRAVLGIPKNVSIVMITPLGYPDEAPPARPRKSLDEIICRDKFC